ncbi:MAG: hypothetical protein Q8Q88_23965 [Phenylobacterium sp.]|uniref:AbiU2 domain-containing protein n=1 Tax=Phenylobacterium sp. TaxID=1871053 RepID=UPI00273237B4|nr:hypothetical protein [Phenylobacterium sp.]MDP3750093.1 hypothetical protein [Phenylobacterium sp.]
MTIRPLSKREKQIAAMSVAERIAMARAKADALVDRCLEVERIHANNRFLIYGRVFGGSLDHTFAGNAYEALRIHSFSFEVLRSMALWDNASEDRISIPEVIALIKEPAVIAQIKAEFFAGYGAEERSFLTGESIKGRFERNLRHALNLAAALSVSQRLKSLRRQRDKFYAHNLTIETLAPKFGYERKLLRSSQRIVNGLRGVLSDAGLDFANTRELNRRHATEFWTGLTWHKP